jgi:hypothetical protein
MTMRTTPTPRTLRLAAMSIALISLNTAPVFASTADKTCNPVTADSSQGSPYDSNSAYRELINNVQKLQFPTSEVNCIPVDDLKARKILHDRFYRSGGNLVFDMRSADSPNRIELRGNSWTSSSTTARDWDGTFVLPNRAAVSEMTIGQVLSESPSVPILRIAYIRSRTTGGTTYSNKIWAAFRTSPDASSATFYLLGDAPNSTTSGRVYMTYGPNGDIVVRYTINGATTTRTLPLGAWRSSSRQVYYKAGCYLQSAGDCRVTFSSLFFND